uniref:Uncharacterized protein n=1 Tax=Solanum lycopersicum TaxID=4081 RepID=A0A3Q7JDD0_SOLLC
MKIYHHVFDGILLHCLFGIVPFEILLLDHYINQLYKDPEWVDFIRQELKNRDFHRRSTRSCYNGWDDPQFFVDPQDMDSILRIHLKILEFNHPSIRSVQVLIGLGLTCFIRYWFPKELISPLSKLILTLPLDLYFVRTQSTEAFTTYVATSPIACSYFVFPLICNQILCFLIPNIYGEQRMK